MSRRFAFHSPGAPSGQFSFSGVYSGFGLADFLFGRPDQFALRCDEIFQPAALLLQLVRSGQLACELETLAQHGPAKRFDHRMEGAAQPPGRVRPGGRRQPGAGRAPRRSREIPCRTGRPWQLGPRFGLAYTITPKTVLRAGGGIFYSFKTVTSGNSLAKNAPFSGTLLTTNDANNFAAAKPISAGFPADRPQLWPIAGTGFYYWPEDAKTSTMYEWNINLQRELVSNLVVSVAYVGGKGTYVDVVGLNINQAVPGPGAVVTRRPYPNLSDATGVVPVGQFHLQFAADHVRAADGRGALFRGLDVGAQHRRHQRRIQQQPDPELPQPGRSAGQFDIRRAAQTGDQRHVRAAVRQGTPLAERRRRAQSSGLPADGRSTPSARSRPGCRSRRRCRRTIEYRDGLAVPEPYRVRRTALRSSARSIAGSTLRPSSRPASTSSGTPGATFCTGRGRGRWISRCSRAFVFRRAAGWSFAPRLSMPSTRRSSIIRTPASGSPAWRGSRARGARPSTSGHPRQIQLAVKLYF